MESSSSNGSNVPLPASQHPLHATDADEEDESVKQLNECATVYLSLQVLSLLSRQVTHFLQYQSQASQVWILSLFVCRTASSSQTATGRSAKHVGLLIRNIFSNKICQFPVEIGIVYQQSKFKCFEQSCFQLIDICKMCKSIEN